jgi:hypothetical protein
MFYDLAGPPGLVAGDLVVMENPTTLSDLLRFDPTGVFVYSDFEPGIPQQALADIGIPTGRLTNVLAVNEVGPEGNNGIVYTPTAGQPGFVAGAAGPVTYRFTSEVPEPTSISLMLLGGSAILLRRRWAKK